MESHTYQRLPAPIAAFADQQYRLAYDLIAAVRDPETGTYADAWRWKDPADRARCSIAAVGVGLIALCIAHAEGWEPDAAALATVTLRSMVGRKRDFRPEREPHTGFFRHFLNGETGETLGQCEFSTIDTALLVAGALFAKQYFGNRELSDLADELYGSIAWEKALADTATGSLYMVIDADGQGARVTHPFNEYALLAWLAQLACPKDAPAAVMWEQVFAAERVASLPHGLYHDMPVLTGPRGSAHLLSSFVHQFPFYLIHQYTVSPEYRAELEAACAVDRRSWMEQPGVPTYIWGMGAGPSIKGYHADAVGRCPDNIASPHIVAGFLPVYPQGIFDLYDLSCRDLPFATYVNANDPEDERAFRAAYRYGLHRFRPGTRWYPAAVTIIDWSTMLYGLGAYHRGIQFFAAHNDFTPGRTPSTHW